MVGCCRAGVKRGSLCVAEITSDSVAGCTLTPPQKSACWNVPSGAKNHRLVCPVPFTSASTTEPESPDDTRRTTRSRGVGYGSSSNPG